MAVTATSTTTPVQVNGNVRNATQRMVQNAGTKNAFLAWGASDIAAVIPTDGTPANGILIQPGAIIVMGFPPNTYFAAICPGSDSTTIYLTPGEGN